jgi:AcrR family transcriptional regulator
MSSVIGTNAIKVDGRTLRSERTHKRIIDAVIQLVEEGNPHLRTAEIAERAEVSVRSIFQHFPDLEALYLSVADAQLRGILADLQPVRTDGDLDERVAALVAERAKLSERTLPMRKLAARFEASSDAATARARFGRDVQRRRSEIAFKPELANVAEGDRKELLDAIQAATDSDAWALLRHHTKLDVAQAEQVWRRLVLALIRDAVGAGAAAQGSAARSPSR